VAKLCYNNQGLAHKFLLATGLFLVSLAVGAVVAPYVSDFVLGELGHLLKPVGGLIPLVLFPVIFLNNAIKTLAVIVFGLLLGVPPFLFTGLNGFVIGVLVRVLAPTTGYGVIAAGLAPHGMIEIPSLLLGTALGFSVGEESLKWLTGRKSQVRLELRRSFRIYLRWILLGLLVAALIEVFVTPHLVHLFGGQRPAF